MCRFSARNFLRLLVACAFVLLLSKESIAQSNPALIHPVRCTGLHYPYPDTNAKYIRLSWTLPGPLAPAPSSPPQNGVTSVFAGRKFMSLVRTPGASDLPFSINNTETTYQNTDYAFNVRYVYRIVTHEYWWNWVQVTYSGGQTGYEWRLNYHVDQTGASFVTVRQVFATHTQSVDSRIDPRYATVVSKNYNFKDSKYRGGLFTGFNADGSRVGRTYLLFPTLTGPIEPTERMWDVGGLQLYATRLARPGTVNLRCRQSGASWTPDTLVWDAAPVLSTTGTATGSVTWSLNNPGQWVVLNPTQEIQDAVVAATPLSLCVYSADETQTAWAYFSKNGFSEDGTLRDCFLLYAFGGTMTPTSSGGSAATLSSLTVPGDIGSNQIKTGTVTLSAAAPSGGAVVTLASSHTNYVTVPASITVPAGQTSVTFNLTAATITSGYATVTITATASNMKTGQVVAHP